MGRWKSVALVGSIFVFAGACGQSLSTKDAGAGGARAVVDGGGAAAGSGGGPGGIDAGRGSGGTAGQRVGGAAGRAAGGESGRAGPTDGPIDAGTDASVTTCPPSDYQATYAPPGCPPLPSGACQSQDDCGGAAYASVIGCRPNACGSAQGTCTLRERMSCPVFAVLNCGCDGNTYGTECDIVEALVAVKYPGPCRSGTITVCDATHPCSNGTCVDDPRASCSPGTDCPGVCLSGAIYPCGQGGTSPSSCIDGYCVAAQQSQCTGSTCDFCTFGSASCDVTGCPDGQLCVPSIGCSTADAGACEKLCVVP